jgi:hypothetical protein
MVQGAPIKAMPPADMRAAPAAADAQPPIVQGTPIKAARVADTPRDRGAGPAPSFEVGSGLSLPAAPAPAAPVIATIVDAQPTILQGVLPKVAPVAERPSDRGAGPTRLFENRSTPVLQPAAAQGDAASFGPNLSPVDAVADGRGSASGDGADAGTAPRQDDAGTPGAPATVAQPADTPAQAANASAQLGSVVVAASPQLPPVQQIAEAIAAAAAPAPPPSVSSTPSAAAQPAVRALDIRLEPADLGAVSVKMRLFGTRLDLHIEVEHKDTLPLLDGDGDALANSLQASGYTIDRLTIRAADAHSTDFQPPPQASPGNGQQPQPQPQSQGQSAQAGLAQGGGGRSGGRQQAQRQPASPVPAGLARPSASGPRARGALYV